MVTTRTGPKLDRLVRFKRGVSVRKFLDFNSPSNWDLTPDVSDTHQSESTHNYLPMPGMHNNTHNHTDPGSIASHRTGNGISARLNGDCKSSVSKDCSYRSDISNRTVLYDTNAAFCFSSVIWDTTIFIAFTLICYTIATFSYQYLGYGIYLLCCALGLVCFHYTITYFDSDEPGVMPPSPMSPSKIRRESGHTFHLSYVMSLLCGVVFLICNIWLSPSSNIPVV